MTIVPVRNLKGEIDCGRTDEEIADSDILVRLRARVFRGAALIGP